MPGDGARELRTYDGRQPLIAAIDGNPATAAVLTMLAEQFGCRVLAERSAEAGLARLRREQRVDLVVIDFTITDMDPFVAAQLIRMGEKHATTPIIAIADTSDPNLQEGRRPHCFSRMLTRPYSPRELYFTFEAALARVSEPALPFA